MIAPTNKPSAEILPQKSERISWASLVLPLVAGLLSLVPPTIVGTGTSALLYQSLEHWTRGQPGAFTALHAHWLWIPYAITFATGGNVFAALLIFKALLVAGSVWLFFQTARRTLSTEHAYWAAALLAFNVTVLYLSHTFGTQLVTMFMAIWLLYLFTSPVKRNHSIAALLFGLSLSIGFWPFILLIAILTVGLNYHHTLYTPRSKRTFILFGLILIGASSWLLLQIFYFGTHDLWHAINPTFYKPREINLILQGIIIAVFSINLLLPASFRRKRGTLARDYQSAFLILGVFFLLNTFSREEMLADAMILLPCLILVALDKATSIKTIGVVYLALNLALFLFIPSFSNNPEIAMASARRIHSNDKVSWGYYSNFDLFSYPKLMEQQAGEEEVRTLLATVRLDSTLVLINPGTDYWFDAATLGSEFPNAHFGWFYGNPINLARINGEKDTAFVRPPNYMPYIAGLFDKSFARTFVDSALPPGVPLHESDRFQYIDTRANEPGKKNLIDRLIYLQYQSFHH
ncbi:MAG TPA: glycosyltransferase family 39 protein [Candidatus Kapabacteria bacterium]|nr:glycosyltransferase family 39 protein [Candidatus Kapabacteria bacterium]